MKQTFEYMTDVGRGLLDAVCACEDNLTGEVVEVRVWASYSMDTVYVRARTKDFRYKTVKFLAAESEEVHRLRAFAIAGVMSMQGPSLEDFAI